MSKKALFFFALFLVISISLVGCSNETTSPEDNDSADEVESESKENNNENEVEEQDESKEDEKSEESDKTDETEETSEVEENVEDNTVQDNVAYVSVDRLNIRADRDAQGTSLGIITKGKQVKVLEEVKDGEDDWLNIQVVNADNTIEGWVLTQYTVKDSRELLSNPNLFEDEEMNEFFTSPTLFENNTVVSYYGHPNSRLMGIVGRHSVQELIPILKNTSEKYDSVNGDKGVIPAIYLIYGTVQPGGEIGVLNYDQMISYIEEAYKNGVLVYLDHQMGKYHPIDALNEILPFLRYPNVHLALDPEWRTNNPMNEIGHLTGEEINQIQETMREYMISNDIPGIRQFVFHQFIEKMVHNIEEVSVDYDPVLLVHNTSGWGPPSGKIATHATNSKATNIPYKGFKLWYYYSDISGVHYDNPLMTPEEVMELNPKPGLIIYQ
ncbi:SH3 domain-containing protein [Evansella sp. AB-P1]|uniref:SH3 domain-containing protein n=1 Tax=Evansella sp. AB-P1 TaxID=3037653 RepID=UPI00241C3267|nr:SH3 domain-containing protein [Evansella sp. AB-P1]MDG5789802.1 SH3 domain-containing protein [Evansella sp. AB-P1]